MADPAPAHLGRNAYIYVRQSTLAQTVRNTESLLRQYDLAGRARQLGWADHQIVVIDDDLGRSGASAQGRKGFSDLVADVGLGKAGIVLSLESSRLARNNADWYQLLDLCALTDTLIADANGVYHPASYNDRLVLGLKGTLSECELHLLRARMTEGLRAKAARGELRLTLPAGLDYDDDDHVIITPDEAVREAVMCVFRRFDQLGSARQVVVSLRADGLRLPRRDIRTGKIAWAQAGYPAVHDILIHPGYAGVFAYGRSKTEKHLDAGGTVITRQRRLPRDQWAVMIPGHHPGYISLDAYDANIARLAANAPRPPAARAGPRGKARPGCRACCGAGGAGGSCRSPTPPAAAPPTGAAGRTRCTAPGPASGSADGGCTKRSWTSCWPCSPRLPWPPPSRPWPTPAPSTARTWPCSNAPPNAPATKPAGRCASTTTSSRKTGWWHGPWRPPWKTSSQPRAPRTTSSPPSAPASPSPSPARRPPGSAPPAPT